MLALCSALFFVSVVPSHFPLRTVLLLLFLLLPLPLFLPYYYSYLAFHFFPSLFLLFIANKYSHPRFKYAHIKSTPRYENDIFS